MKSKYGLSSLRIGTALLVVFMCACSNELQEDRNYWKNNRSGLVALNDKLVLLYKKTGLSAFTRDSIGLDFKRQMTLKDASNKYPEYANDIEDVTRILKSTKFHWISLTNDYVAFFRSGGLGTDTTLLHTITDRGLAAYKNDFMADGFRVQATLELEKGWLFAYTD